MSDAARKLAETVLQELDGEFRPPGTDPCYGERVFVQLRDLSGPYAQIVQVQRGLEVMRRAARALLEELDAD